MAEAEGRGDHLTVATLAVPFFCVLKKKQLQLLVVLMDSGN